MQEALAPFVDNKRKQREERLRKRRLELMAERVAEEATLRKEHAEKQMEKYEAAAKAKVRKRGRPWGSGKPIPEHLENVPDKARKLAAWRKKSGQAQLELGAEEKIALGKKLQEKAEASPGAAPTKFWQDREQELGMPRHLLRKWTDKKSQAAVEAWRQKRLSDDSAVYAKAGRKRTWKRFESQDKGLRVGKNGGKNLPPPPPSINYSYCSYY